MDAIPWNAGRLRTTVTRGCRDSTASTYGSSDSAVALFSTNMKEGAIEGTGDRVGTTAAVLYEVGANVSSLLRSSAATAPAAKEK